MLPPTIFLQVPFGNAIQAFLSLSILEVPGQAPPSLPHFLKIDVKSPASKKVLDSKDQAAVVESKQIASPVAVGLFKTETQQTSTLSPDRDSWLKTLRQCVEESHLFLKEQESLPTLIESMLVEMHSKKFST